MARRRSGRPRHGGELEAAPVAERQHAGKTAGLAAPPSQFGDHSVADAAELLSALHNRPGRRR